MADWTAITGIIVAGVVGPALGARTASKRLKREHTHDRAMADRSELRELLDGAAQRLQKVSRYHEQLPGLLLTHGVWIVERAGEQLSPFWAGAREADLDRARLALRLGPGHPVVEAHEQAFEILLHSSNVLRRLDVMRHNADLLEASKTLDDGVEELATAAAQFMQAAHLLAASRL